MLTAKPAFFVKVLFVAVVASLAIVLAGCGALAELFPGGTTPSAESQSSTESSTTTHSSRSQTNEINGQPIGGEQQTAQQQQESTGAEFGATCTRMDECASRLCFVGQRGNVGFCTQPCDRRMDCPMRWECERPSNAAQRVCVQSSW